MLHILHGEEEFTRAEELAHLKAQVASDGMGDLNIVVLDGRKLRLEELIAACDALPFLGTRRLVVVEGLLQRLESRARPKEGEESSEEASAPADPALAKGLLAYLPQLPPTTDLVLVEAKALKASNPVLKSAPKLGARVHEYGLLRKEALKNWVIARARSKGVAIAEEACELLMRYLGSDLRALDTELEKLAAHAGYARETTREDVAALVSATVEEQVWGMVDALGARDRAAATELLERMLAQDQHPLYLLSMFTRQFRLILSAKELSEERKLSLPAVQAELGVRDFVAEKLLQQARTFSLAELERVLERLLELDQGIKTGRMDGQLGLELLTVEVCRRRRGQPAGYQPRSRVRTR